MLRSLSLSEAPCVLHAMPLPSTRCLLSEDSALSTHPYDHTVMNPRELSSPSSSDSTDNMIQSLQKLGTAMGQSKIDKGSPGLPTTSSPSSDPPLDTQPPGDQVEPSKKIILSDWYPRLDRAASTGLQQCIALILNHAGFDSATPQAMEDLTMKTEQFFGHFGASINHAAITARRSVPVAVDYELALSRNMFAPWMLNTHLKPPVRLPEISVPESVFAKVFPRTVIPDFHVFDILSGEPDRKSKSYIPTHFPAFPSVHAYRSTPVSSSMGTSVIRGEEHSDEASAHLAARDKIRKQAAINAKNGEKALQAIICATKITHQKDATAAIKAGNDWGVKHRQEGAEKSFEGFSALAMKAAESVVQVEGFTRVRSKTARTLEDENRKLMATKMTERSMVVNSKAAFKREVPLNNNKNRNRNDGHGMSSSSSTIRGVLAYGGISIEETAPGWPKFGQGPGGELAAKRKRDDSAEMEDALVTDAENEQEENPAPKQRKIVIKIPESYYTQRRTRSGLRRAN